MNYKSNKYKYKTLGLYLFDADSRVTLPPPLNDFTYL